MNKEMRLNQLRAMGELTCYIIFTTFLRTKINRFTTIHSQESNVYQPTQENVVDTGRWMSSIKHRMKMS